MFILSTEKINFFISLETSFKYDDILCSVGAPHIISYSFTTQYTAKTYSFRRIALIKMCAKIIDSIWSIIFSIFLIGYESVELIIMLIRK